MEKTLDIIDLGKDWGWMKADSSGRLTEINEDFCRNFSVNREYWLGLPISEIIGVFEKKHKNVIFATISGFSCLLRVYKTENQKIYRVILRYDEIDLQELTSFINAIERPKKKQKTSSQNLYSFDEIVGVSKTMEYIKELAARIAASNSTVLLTGESGTGKELFAQAIHGLSTRKNHPFIAINCASVPDELFESELFGYEAGAFSGAKKEGKPGKIELAQNGTLFLDEISELPLQTQGKLLRVLQEREIERLGGTVTKNVDIRIIAATNRDLRLLVNEGKFRQDLFYRLYVFDLRIPSLRERKEDIVPLTHYFIEYFNRRLGTEVTTIEAELREWLLEYEWPGNVRELKAAIERGMNIVEGTMLTLKDVSFSHSLQGEVSIQGRTEQAPLNSLEEAVNKAEITAIRQALEASGGDRSAAAQILKIHIASLYRKITKYKLK